MENDLKNETSLERGRMNKAYKLPKIVPKKIDVDKTVELSNAIEGACKERGRFGMIRRCLLVYQGEGRGTKDDVYRRVMYFYDAETLELLARVDPMESEKTANLERSS